jgi:hypothetical protein
VVIIALYIENNPVVSYDFGYLLQFIKIIEHCFGKQRLENIFLNLFGERKIITLSLPNGVRKLNTINQEE